jgi:hypothetical protein
VTVDSVQPVNPPRADQPDSPDVAVDGGGAGPGERAGGAPVVRPARRWSRRSGELRVAGAHAGGRPVGRAGAVPRDPHPLLRQVPAAFVSAIGGAPRRPCGGRPGCARLPAGLAAPGPRCTRWTFPEVLNSKEAVIRTPGATPNCETAHGRRGSPEKRPGPRRSSPAHKAPTAPDRGLCRRAGAGAGGVLDAGTVLVHALVVAHGARALPIVGLANDHADLIDGELVVARPRLVAPQRADPGPNRRPGAMLALVGVDRGQIDLRQRGELGDI